MNTSRIIKGAVSSGRYTVTAPIVKEDYGLYLQIEGVELPSTYEVDFSNSENSGSSVTMIGNADGVLIPHQFIDTGKDVFAFLYHVGANYGRTVYKFRIPNKYRPDRTNEEPTPEEQSVIDQAISALNTAVAQTAQDVIDSDASAQNASADAERAEDARTDAQNYATQAEQSATDAHESASQASASATASANSASQSAQIKADVESLAEDAQNFATQAEQSAQNAHTYALSANAASDTAENFADVASGYASQAQTSAQTASSKASEASGYASTASTKASESAQSASLALTYKTDAESAKVASQTAQGLAESARDDAIDAKTDAESARDEAQSIVDGISGKVEQIDSNTERIESLEDDRYKPYPTDTASGAVASFSDGADNIPLKSLIVSIDPVQDTSSGDPSPENICPISGWTGMEIQHDGKNLVSKTISGYQINASGVISVNPNYDVQVGAVKTGESYTITNGDSNIVIAFYTSEPSIGSAAYDGIRVVQTSHVFTAPINGFVAFRTNSGYSTPQLEVGSTATPYEPYTGRSITIDLGQTVYGGHLDVLTGELVVDWRYALLNNPDDWTQLTTGLQYGVIFEDRKLTNTSYDGLVCSFAPASARAPVRSRWTSASTLRFMIQDDTGGLTLAQVKQYATDGSIAIVYELANPITIQLTPNQVNSLLGVNNIWADSGDTEAVYRADTKLYIERLTAPDSADMIADANIVSGQYFMVGNSLYKATANIANGGQIIVGTNCTRVSLAQALNEINA